MSQPAPEVDVVWDASVDESTWHIQVIRNGAYTGVLVVTLNATGEVILREEVGLSFDADFGPDIADVGMWQVMALEAIDHFNAQHPEAS